MDWAWIVAVYLCVGLVHNACLLAAWARMQTKLDQREVGVFAYWAALAIPIWPVVLTAFVFSTIAFAVGKK